MRNCRRGRSPTCRAWQSPIIRTSCAISSINCWREQPPEAFSSEVETGWRQENASNYKALPHHTAATGPETGFQHLLVDLADAGHRQFGDERDVLGRMRRA